MQPIPTALHQAVAGRYRITAELGRGGMATVYRADDLRHEREVALKVLRPEVAAAIGTERFLLEVHLMARLNHPHILPLLESGESGGTLWYAMPFVTGESLRHRLDRGEKLPPHEAVTITRQVGAALEFAHRRGVVHRDIKPENILLHEGEAMVADFGIALVANAARTERLTATGISPGTLTYMSPEQLGGERDVDGRADQYALACVLFEMLTGAPPAIGAAPALRTGPELSSSVARALRTALAMDRDQRFGSVQEFLDAIGSSDPTRRFSRTRIAAMSAIGAGAVLAVALPVRHRLEVARAEALVPQVAELAGAGKFSEAYLLAARLERTLSRDSALIRLMPRIADWLTVESVPAGAEVWLQAFQPDSGGRFPDSMKVGVTPIRNLRLPRIGHRMVVRKAGYAPVERMASTATARVGRVDDTTRAALTVNLVLRPADSVPAGMVPVEGGRYELVSPDVPVGLTAELSNYFIDRTEVSNAAFREFVRADGYRLDSLWSGVDRKPFVDRTGLPSPRSWSGQDFPAGRDNYPVTDVSWFEALAFCRWRGATLPTVFEWEKAARNGETTTRGTLMPWGLAEGPVQWRANFSSTGPMPVDAYPFGVSPWGAWAMAGNVKEWSFNSLGSGRAVTGGSWEDPSYLYSEYGEHDPERGTASLGFRCAYPDPAGTGDRGAGPLRLAIRSPVYHPVDERTLQSFLAFYRYDRRPLDPRVVARVETPDWIREKIRYRGIGVDSILAYLYLPRHAAAPFQTLVYISASNVFAGDSVWHEPERLAASIIRGGRAVLAPVLEGMTEREFPSGTRLPAAPTVGFRDLMIRHSTEVRTSLDYLATRSDIDTTRIAYIGVSFGSGSRLPLAGTDDRWKGLILVGAGIDERLQPTLPEASNINFAPWLKPPKLVINGRQDERLPWLTRGLPLWNLLRQPKKLVLAEGAGHVPPPEVLVPAASQWLDQILGPVRR